MSFGSQVYEGKTIKDRGNCPVKRLSLRLLLRCRLRSLLRLCIHILKLSGHRRSVVMTAASGSLGVPVACKGRQHEEHDSAEEHESSGDDHSEADEVCSR